MLQQELADSSTYIHGDFHDTRWDERHTRTVLTRLDTKDVPTAAPAKGLTVTRCPSVRKALGFNGDSYRIGVRVRGFELGRSLNSSYDSRRNSPARGLDVLVTVLRVADPGLDGWRSAGDERRRGVPPVERLEGGTIPSPISVSSS